MSKAIENLIEAQQDALIFALCTDQAGNGTFPEFLKRSLEAGVTHYEVDFEKR